MKITRLEARVRDMALARADSPVFNVAAVLWERLRQDRLALTAGSLTYITVLALVPIFTVALSVFTLFPAFRQMEGALQTWLIERFIPADISSSVMAYLTQFSGKASQLGLVGIAGFGLIALSLILTVDKTLNQIWRVSDKRLLGQRILIYWAALTLGPLLVGASTVITSYVVTSSSGWFPGLFAGADLVLGALQFLLIAGGLTLLYRFVPNAPVRWEHAFVGALFVTVTLALARWGLGVYVAHVPTYSHIYGTFAVLPILLLWIYVSWLIVLFGAVIAAYLPSIVHGVVRRSNVPGWRFELALEVVAALFPTRGLTLRQLARRLRVDELELGPVLTDLCELDWAGQLATQKENEAPRYVALIDLQEPVLQLVERLLIDRDSAFLAATRDKPLSELSVADVVRPAATGAAGSAPRCPAPPGRSREAAAH